VRCRFGATRRNHRAFCLNGRAECCGGADGGHRLHPLHLAWLRLGGKPLQRQIQRLPGCSITGKSRRKTEEHKGKRGRCTQAQTTWPLHNYPPLKSPTTTQDLRPRVDPTSCRPGPSTKKRN
jgi:hypothetical protein